MMQSEKRPRMCTDPYLVHSAMPFHNAFGDVDDSYKHTTKMMKLEDSSPPRSSPPSTPPLMTKRQRKLKRTIPRPPQLQRVVRTAPPVFGRTASRMKVLRDPVPAIVTFKPPNEAPTLSSLYNKTLRDDLTYIDQCFDRHKTIGSGSFSRVIRARSKDDHKFYAIKCKKNPFGSLSSRLNEIEEVRKHELLSEHPNIIKFVCAWEENGLLFIQMELCEKSLNVVCNEEHELSEFRVWSYFIDILMAVNHLHQNNLIHLDIKPENVLVSSEDVCKLGDFGLVFDEINDDARRVTEGDCKYLAMEFLSDGKPTQKADIFSLGLTLLEIATDMDLPLRGRYWAELRRGEIRPEFLKGVSYGMHEVISAMIRPEPTRRPSAVDILEHQYIKEQMSARQLQIYQQYCSGKKGFSLMSILSRFL